MSTLHKMASIDRIQPLASQDTNARFNFSNSKNTALKKPGQFNNTLKSFENSSLTSGATPLKSSLNHTHLHHHNNHKTVTTPTSSYKKSLKLPLLEQLSLSPILRKNGNSGVSANGRSYRTNDKENNPFVTFSTRQNTTFSGNKLLHQGSATKKFNFSNPTTHNKHNLVSRNSMEMDLDDHMEAFDSCKNTDGTNDNENNDDDNNNNDGSNALINAAAIINAKLEELQDKENIPPLNSPAPVKRRVNFMTANASGIDEDLVDGLKFAFSSNQFKRKPLSVISLAVDDSQVSKKRREIHINHNVASNNYQSPSYKPTGNGNSRVDNETNGKANVNEQTEEQDVNYDGEEDDNGKYIYLNSQLAPEAGEMDSEDFDNMPDLDQIAESEQSTATTTSTTTTTTTTQNSEDQGTSRHNNKNGNLNNSVISEFVPVTPSAVSANKVNSPIFFTRQEVLKSPFNFQTQNTNRKSSLHEQHSLSLHNTSTTKAINSNGPKFTAMTQSAARPSTQGLPSSSSSSSSIPNSSSSNTSTQSAPSLGYSSIHNSTNRSIHGSSGVNGMRAKTQQKKKMVFMR